MKRFAMVADSGLVEFEFGNKEAICVGRAKFKVLLEVVHVSEI